jgi:two-component system, cell cycle sensor histidine kinase and response regulator CckA
MRPLDSSSRTSLLLLIAFVVLDVGIAVTGYHLHDRQVAAAETDAQNQLLAVADMKASLLSAWREERLADARGIMANSMILPSIQRVLSRQDRGDQLQAWMATMLQGFGYSAAVLVDRSGNRLIGVGGNFGSAEHLRDSARSAIERGEAVLSDFHTDTGLKEIHLSLSIPIASKGNTPIGAMLLRIDTGAAPFDSLERWPAASKSGEISLVRREGESALYLTQLRHRPGKVMSVQTPLTGTSDPAVSAALGMEGLFRGRDYRRTPVLSAIRRVPGSDWYVVAKIDEDEVHAPVHQRTLFLAIAVASLILAVGCSVALVWRHQRARFYKERYQAEMERKALLGHYGYLTKFANDVIVLADDTGRIVEANDRACDTYGYSREELTSMNVRDLRHPEAAVAFDRELAAVTEDGRIFRCVDMRRDGSRFPVEMSIRAIEVEGRKFHQEIARDITDRDAMEERLREANQALNAIIGASPVAIVTLDPDGIVKTWNHAAQRVFGWTAEEAIGQHAPFIPGDKEEESLAIRQMSLSGLNCEGLQLQLMRKKGTPVAVRLFTAPLRDPEGNPNGILEMLTDETERVEAEESLRASEARYRQVVEGAPLGIFVQIGGLFRYANPSAMKMLGADRIEQLLDQPILDFIHPDSKEAVAQRMTQINVKRSPNPLAFFKYLKVDGASFEGTASAVPFVHEGQEGALVFFTDISDRIRAEEERRHIEEQLRHAQKMESVGRLAGGVAHDFNNHLTVINGYCELLINDPGLPEGVREQIGEILDSGRRAESVTQQLLAFSRKQVIEPRPLDLNHLIEETQRMLRRLIGEDIELVLNLTAGLGYVMADPGQMNQVFMNLAVNAQDAMPEGGRLLIQTSRAGTGAGRGSSGGGMNALITISDTGIGMEPEIRDRVFEPFFTTKEDGAGTGLGLATVYGIVKQIGGSIQVDSEPGAGATFKILLPLTDAIPSESDGYGSTAAGSRDAGGTETVLVAEDQFQVRKLVSEILSGHGYFVLEAASGPEALAVCEAHAGPIDLLLTDVIMPGMTGRELAECILVKRPHTKVLYMSGYSADVISRRGMLKPGVAYLPKPFTPGRLTAKVRQVLSGPARRPSILLAVEDGTVRASLRDALEQSGFEIFEAADGPSAIHIVKAIQLEAVVTGSVELIRDIRTAGSGIKIVALTADSETAAAADATLPATADPAALVQALQTFMTGK